MSDSDAQVFAKPVFRLVAIAFLIVLLLKLFFAAALDLYSDEVFYWQASAYPALAYSDLPFMTSLLVGLGSALDPGNAFAARVLFIVLGSSIPFLIYWLAIPITNRQEALEAAGLSLCLPLSGFLGLLAVPDVPLLFFGILSVGFFDRALRSNELKYWMATGIFVALGLCTHYRFFLYPAAVIIFLGFYSPARVQFKNPKFWLTILVSAIGLIPIIWFNLNNELSSASFYFLDRHPWEFQLSGLLHVFKQAGLSSPPLYLIFLFTAYLMYEKSKLDNRSAALLLSIALTNLLVYLIFAPWTDATSTSIHWPLSGYMPLLVFTPFALRKTYQWTKEKWNFVIATNLCKAIPMIGFSGTLIALVGVGSQAFQMPLQAIVGTGVLSNKMAGWREFSIHTNTLIREEFSAAKPIIVTDNYYTAAQVEFAGIAQEVYTLDRDKAVRDGRFTQYELWAKDEMALANITGRPMLYINEDSTLTVPDKHELLFAMCSYVNQIDLIDELILYNGDKSFSFYRADNLLGRSTASAYRATPCPFPPRAWIDFPEADETLSGIVNVSGWAYNEDIGIERVELVINNDMIATANYGMLRPDVVSAMGVGTDPNAPNLGFNIAFDSTGIDNGRAELAIDLINQQGHRSRYGSRLIRIDN
ncbi:MAG: glycosyltransferase family 39 protein [Gammaproteobacteria bacterium]|nr:glycosyltransferase family 39 protein [Gammaproteobacteria bacterium]